MGYADLDIQQRLPAVEERIRKRLHEFSGRLGKADWFEGAFSAGDFHMVSVLRRLKTSGLPDEYLNFSAYIAPGEARPHTNVPSTCGFRDGK